MNLVRIETGPPNKAGPDEIIIPPKGAYFVTQSLRPAYYQLNARKQITETRNIFKKLLKRYSNNFQFVIELTKASNVHYHGWFTLEQDTELARLCLIDDLKILGNVKIDLIKGNAENIRNYLHKDTEKTDQLINYTRKGKPKTPNIKMFTRHDEAPQTVIFNKKEIITATLDFDDDLFASSN